MKKEEAMSDDSNVVPINAKNIREAIHAMLMSLSDDDITHLLASSDEEIEEVLVQEIQAEAQVRRDRASRRGDAR